MLDPNRLAPDRFRSRSRLRPGHAWRSDRASSRDVRPGPGCDRHELWPIVVALDRLHAPITAGNFLHYVDTHRLDGETFYRALRIGEGGLIQGGVRSDTRKLFPPIAHESTAKTGLHNVAGSIVMARLQPGTAQADFFILASDTPAYDAGAPDGDADGFAVFGQVVEGMDVVRKILAAPTSPTEGEGVMKGQMLDPRIRIIKAERVK